MEQEERRDQVGTMGGVPGQHRPGCLPRDQGHG